MSEATKLGIFGHHPDPAIDFEVEVQDLIAEAWTRDHNLPAIPDLDSRIERAMEFRVGGVPSCVSAKAMLRDLRSRTQSKADAAWNTRATDPAVAGLVEGLANARAALGKAAGTALGVAMSTEHPNPSGALTDVFHVCNEADQEIAAILATYKEKTDADEG